MPPERVTEDNWFFRLSRNAGTLARLIRTGRLRILPEQHEREVLSLVEGGLQDFSISRSQERAHGWGMPVPDDCDQAVYVWFDALVNYVSALDFGAESDLYSAWWLNARERIHVIGKNVIRFHAVYWPAMLLSAGAPVPTTILVHQFLTIGGRKISKSLGNAIDPFNLVDRFGSDAVRWWLLREPSPTADTDFTIERLTARANADLANGIGNLVNRVVAMVNRYRAGRVPQSNQHDAVLQRSVQGLPQRIEAAMGRFDLREAASRLVGVVDGGQRLDQPHPALGSGRRRAGRGQECRRRSRQRFGRACRGSAGYRGGIRRLRSRSSERLDQQLAGPVLPPAKPVFQLVPPLEHRRRGGDPST